MSLLEGRFLLGEMLDPVSGNKSWKIKGRKCCNSSLAICTKLSLTSFVDEQHVSHISLLFLFCLIELLARTHLAMDLPGSGFEQTLMTTMSASS